MSVKASGRYCYLLLFGALIGIRTGRMGIYATGCRGAREWGVCVGEAHGGDKIIMSKRARPVWVRPL